MIACLLERIARFIELALKALVTITTHKACCCCKSQEMTPGIEEMVRSLMTAIYESLILACKRRTSGNFLRHGLCLKIACFCGSKVVNSSEKLELKSPRELNTPSHSHCHRHNGYLLPRGQPCPTGRWRLLTPAATYPSSPTP